MNDQLKTLAEQVDTTARKAMLSANRDKSDLAEAVWKLAQTVRWMADNWPATTPGNAPGTPAG